MIIGITGTDGAGKGTVVEYLKTKGFTHYSARELIVAEIERQGLPVSRNQMRLTANEMRAAQGNEYVIKESYKRATKAGVTNAVIESLRATAEAEYLKAQGGILLAVDAEQAVRYERVQARRSESDQVTFEQFVEHEELEKNDPDPNGMQKAKVIAMADYTITNDGTVEELEAQVERFLEAFAEAADMVTLHKSAWLCIEDRKVLFARSEENAATYYLPGGKREPGESDVEALIREVKEETTVMLLPDTIKHAKTFTDHAHGKPANVMVEVKAYFADYEGALMESEEIAELAWLTSADTDKLYGVGVQTIEWLKEQDLID
jgi:dephospho-CoA kinase/8-oxo-dGTP pyrophosphatase MutT (NUDIX family)